MARSREIAHPARVGERCAHCAGNSVMGTQL